MVMKREYRGQRSAEAMKNYILEMLKDQVVEVPHEAEAQHVEMLSLTKLRRSSTGLVLTRLVLEWLQQRLHLPVGGARAMRSVRRVRGTKRVLNDMRVFVYFSI
ncbi:hypothetical protein V5799_015751 [Amblyomma americanum]|uniref:Uncharacterized protein n=1 Tax=Amblyomma americanum TaxID=6943 RepID=A0AAQ4F6Y0_AMBAM